MAERDSRGNAGRLNLRLSGSPSGDSAAVRITSSLQDFGVSHIFPRGTELLQQGQVPHQICLIETGLVKLSCLTDSGEEAIVGLRYHGWPLGVTSLLCHTPSPFSATALSRSQIRSIPPNVFRRMLKSKPELVLAIAELSSQEIIRYVGQLSDLAFCSARQRLERVLAQVLELMEQQRSVPAGGIPVPLRQWELAQMIVVRAPYLNRLIAELETEGIIARRRGWLLIPDPTRLKRRNAV